MTITNEILMEFKERMRLGDHEDENLIRILSASVEALKVPCGIVILKPMNHLKNLYLKGLDMSIMIFGVL